MMPPLVSEPPPTTVRWAPCSHACYQTLHWPCAPQSTPDAEATPRLSGHPPGQPLQPAPEPWVPEPAHRILALCGEDGLRRLVQCHMARLRRTPLFNRAGRCADYVAQRVADFVVQACGGGLFHSARHSRLQAGAGLPLLLDETGRELWLVQLWHAFDDAGFPPPARADFWNWAEPLSVLMMAPRSRHPGLTRYPYDTVRSWFLKGAPS